MTIFRNLGVLVLLLLTMRGVAEQRKALVIGNDSYPGNSLQNARNDAKAVHAALESAGYAATLLLDADKSTMSSKVDAFVDTLHPGSVALLYYAGHGMQVGGENYLIPVDFKLTSEASAADQAYSLSSILERFTAHGATTQVVILDACRDNPFLGSRSVRGGWAGMGTSAGAFLAFGTSPGSTASDDPNQGHGLFTNSLLRYLTSTDLDIELLFRKVRQDVISNSGGKQVPWVSSSLIGSLHVDPKLDEKAPLLEIGTGPSSSDPDDRGRTLNSGRRVRTAAYSSTSNSELLSHAIAVAQHGDISQATSLLEEGDVEGRGSAAELRVFGLLLHAVNRDRDALRVLDRAVALSGSDPRAANYKCAIETLKESTPAVRDCNDLVRSQPSSEGFLLQAGALATRGLVHQAYTKATEAIQSGAGKLAYALRGAIAEREGRPGLAEDDLTQAAQTGLLSQH